MGNTLSPEFGRKETDLNRPQSGLYIIDQVFEADLGIRSSRRSLWSEL